MATALMTIARKVIILDYTKIRPDYVWATGGVVLALSIGYWLVAGFSEASKTNDGPPLPLSRCRLQAAALAEPQQPTPLSEAATAGDETI